MTQVIKKCQDAAKFAICSKWFIPAIIAVAALAMCTGLNLAGTAVLGIVSMLLLLFSDDTFAALCPIFAAVLCATSFYMNYLELLEYAWAFIPYAAALVVHIVAYRGKFVRGKMLWSLVAVSVALLLGGIGVIPSGEYFSGVSLFHMIGLGAALVPIYMLLCGRMSRKRDYSITDMFASLLYGMGLLAALIIILYYIEHSYVLTIPFETPFIDFRNFCTTVMLYAMPMCCIFVPRNRIHLLGMAFIYIIMLAGGSRSALLFGSLEFGMCLIYIFWRYKESRKRFVRTCLWSALPFLAVWCFVVYFVFIGAGGRFGVHFIRPDEARPDFYKQGVLDFLAHPLLGNGLGNMKNAEIYQGIPGSLNFYHNAILQVIASLGVVGIVAYLYQFYQRTMLLISKRRSEVFVMALGFIGILMMSQTNPGLFCPVPTGLVLVTMFAVVEFENSAELAQK